MKAGRPTTIMAVIVLLAFAFAMVGCAGPEEQERAGAVGGEDAAQRAREAKPPKAGAA